MLPTRDGVAFVISLDVTAFFQATQNGLATTDRERRQVGCNLPGDGSHENSRDSAY